MTPFRNDGLGQQFHGATTTFWAGAKSTPEARADGNGGLLARGYYAISHMGERTGPWRTRLGAVSRSEPAPSIKDRKTGWARERFPDQA